jgi:hypothetical protein
VVDAELDGPAQDRAHSVGVRRRPKDTGAGELHRAEADAANDFVTQKRCRGHCGHLPSFLNWMRATSHRAR